MSREISYAKYASSFIKQPQELYSQYTSMSHYPIMTVRFLKSLESDHQIQSQFFNECSSLSEFQVDLILTYGTKSQIDLVFTAACVQQFQGPVWQLFSPSHLQTIKELRLPNLSSHATAYLDITMLLEMAQSYLNTENFPSIEDYKWIAGLSTQQIQSKLWQVDNAWEIFTAPSVASWGRHGASLQLVHLISSITPLHTIQQLNPTWLFDLTHRWLRLLEIKNELGSHHPASENLKAALNDISNMFLLVVGLEQNFGSSLTIGTRQLIVHLFFLHEYTIRHNRAELLDTTSIALYEYLRSKVFNYSLQFGHSIFAKKASRQWIWSALQLFIGFDKNFCKPIHSAMIGWFKNTPHQEIEQWTIMYPQEIGQLLKTINYIEECKGIKEAVMIISKNGLLTQYLENSLASSWVMCE